MEADPLNLPRSSPAAAPYPSTGTRPVMPTAAATVAGADGAAGRFDAYPLERALARARAGETHAFRELVHAHQGSVYSLALRLLGVREDAQELAQDVFMLLHRHLGSIVSAPHLHFWLRRTVCHRAIDRLRRRRSAIVALPLDAAAQLEAPTHSDDPLRDRRLRQLIAQLPPVPRAVLLLRYQEDLDPPQIARVLGLALNTVKSHLKRSLALLRGRCGELNPADTGGAHT